MQKLAKYQQTESWPNEIYSWNKRMDFSQYHIPHEQSKGEEIPQNHLNAKKKKSIWQNSTLPWEKKTQLEAEGNYLKL